jgi:alkanesulfonate monooxygenase SsuD/methylene tetrahydromethanopterin reductase-like flavin-dependent oxidoreductase (luciferase family)
MKIDIFIESKVGAARFRDIGLLAEEYGFNAIWVQNYARAPDAFMTAVPLALASSRIRVGLAVISPYEAHPLKIANSLLTLNEYAKGRASVVISGGGEWPAVMKKELGKRITGARETLEIIRAACHEDVVNYEGEVYSAQAFVARWTTQPPPRVYMGANGPKMLAMAAHAADGVMMSDVQPEMLDWGMPSLEAALAESTKAESTEAESTQAESTQDDAGYSGAFHLNNFLSWHVKEDAEASRWEARRELIIRGWLEPQWIEPYLDAGDVKTVRANVWPFLKAFRERTGDIEGVPAHIVDALVEGLTCAGGPEDLDRHIERLLIYKAAGFTELSLGLQDDPEDSIRMIGEKVLPALQ